MKRFDWKLFKRAGVDEEEQGGGEEEEVGRVAELKWLMARLMNKNLFINRKRSQGKAIKMSKFIIPMVHQAWRPL